MRTPASELRRLHPVSENHELAACERAQRHDSATGEPVGVRRIGEHLGFEGAAYTTRRLRPLLRALEQAGVLERSRAYGGERWGLTPAGRRRLRRARAASEQLALAEAPQHREWRRKHTMAVAGMESYRRRMRQVLREAAQLLEDECSDSEAWRAMAKRLNVRAELLSSAIYCAREWPEPDDSQRDIDDSRTLDDRRRLLRRFEEDV
jgi:DNA-binding MarR family transcriptional regulator